MDHFNGERQISLFLLLVVVIITVSKSKSDISIVFFVAQCFPKKSTYEYEMNIFEFLKYVDTKSYSFIATSCHVTMTNPGNSRNNRLRICFQYFTSPKYFGTSYH